MSPAEEKRHVPRIEPLDHTIHCAFEQITEFSGARIRDLAIDSLRFEFPGLPPSRLTPSLETVFSGFIPELGLFVQCHSRVARTYVSKPNGPQISGAAIRLLDLDTHTRDQISALHQDTP